jgi:hypothetical protein
MSKRNTSFLTLEVLKGKGVSVLRWNHALEMCRGLEVQIHAHRH